MPRPEGRPERKPQAKPALPVYTSVITRMDVDDLVRTGAGLHGAYMLEQINATLGLARRKGVPLEALLPTGFLAAAEQARLAMQDGMGNKRNLAEESKDATHVQNDTLRKTREWKRKMAALGGMAARGGEEVPDILRRIGAGGHSVPITLRLMEEALKVLQGESAKLDRYPLYGIVLGEGQTLKDTLATVDTDQENKRLLDLPDGVRSYYAAKGVAYLAVKTINDAGHALYAGNPTASGKFNLAVLYRNTGRGHDDEEPSSPPQSPQTPQ